MNATFRQWREHRHDYAKQWKARTGGKVLGYFCTYVPEEILYAGGVLPVRILGTHEPQDVTEPYIFGMYCPFCRDCLAQGLKGRFDYLDGIMIAQSCLHIRQAFTSWQKHVPVPFSYYLPMPNHLQSPRAYPYLTGELRSFKAAVERWLDTTISESQLDQAIKTHNTSRQLLQRLYALLRQDPPPIRGEEVMEIVLSSQMVDKEEHNRTLAARLAELQNPAQSPPPGIRLMIIGSEDDDVEFIRMVESLGATFVVDEHCTGSRYFWNEVKPSGNHLEALAARYIERPPCPSKDWPQRTRLPHIVKLAKDFGVRGAILVQQKFCDPHELDTPAIMQTLEKEGIPSLFLEFDVTVPVGQFKTRCEAFLEMLREEELF